MSPNKIFNQLLGLTSESRNPASQAIDIADTKAILRIINQEDQKVACAVQKELPSIALAVEMVVDAFKNRGRLIYVGAGTSGRLGILDAAECPPTYGTNPSMVQGIIAGGKKAVFRSQEGAEDKESNGTKAIAGKKVKPNDVVCGIAASMRTPFVIGAIREANRRGARTILVTTNPPSILKQPTYKSLRASLDVAICVEVGPEVIMGSTRMKAGTAQKMVLNMITTASMTRLGKVYQNMMVDLKITNRKLGERAKRVVMIATGVDYETASKALRAAGNHVKTAIVMILGNTDAREAKKRLKQAGGFVHYAIKNLILGEKKVIIILKGTSK